MVALFPVTLLLPPTVTQVASRAVAEMALLQPCGHPLFADIFKLRTGEVGSFSSNYVGVRSFWDMKVTPFFCFLACTSLFGGRTSRRLLQKESNSEQQNMSVGNMSQVIYSLLFSEREMFMGSLNGFRILDKGWLQKEFVVLSCSPYVCQLPVNTLCCNTAFCNVSRGKKGDQKTCH